MNKFALLLSSIAICLPLVGMVGCETESSDQASISITPNTVSLATGDSQEFRASGWQDYSWSLSDSSLGVLSASTGDRTTYTAVVSNTTQVLTVTAYSGPTIATNATSLTAQALITHL
jgi:hypothetical protein